MTTRWSAFLYVRRGVFLSLSAQPVRASRVLLARPFGRPRACVCACHGRTAWIELSGPVMFDKLTATSANSEWPNCV